MTKFSKLEFLWMRETLSECCCVTQSVLGLRAVNEIKARLCMISNYSWFLVWLICHLFNGLGSIWRCRELMWGWEYPLVVFSALLGQDSPATAPWICRTAEPRYLFPCWPPPDVLLSVGSITQLLIPNEIMQWLSPSLPQLFVSHWVLAERIFNFYCGKKCQNET